MWGGAVVAMMSQTAGQKGLSVGWWRDERWWGAGVVVFFFFFPQ